MDINRFTESVQQALSAAQTKAVRYGHQQIDVEHLLLALLEQERGLATAIFTKAEVPTDSLKRRVEQELERLPKVGGPSGAPADQIYVTGRLNRLSPRLRTKPRNYTMSLFPSSTCCSP
jgi:ATP-dependent Clp protease ATP-binding subunit ClpB